MRVLMTTDTVGGVWTYAMDLCRELCVRQARVHLMTMGRALSAAQRRTAERIAGLSLRPTSYRLEWMHDPWADVWAAGDVLLHEARMFQPQLVQLNNYAHGVLPFDCPVVVVGHSCVDTWYRAVLGKPSGCDWQTYRQVVSQGIHAADVLVTDASLRHATGRQLWQSSSGGDHSQRA